MEQPPTSAKRADALLNRSRILEAALAIFAERGLDLEVEGIAARASLGVGTLYRHFTNRDELLRAILVHILDDTLAQFHSAVTAVDHDPQGALLAFISTALRLQQQYGPLFSVIRDPRLARIFDQTQTQTLRDQFLAVILNIVQNGVKANIFRDDLDHEMVAATIMGSVMAVSDLFLTRWSREELADKLYQLHLAMLTRTGDR